MKVLTKPVPRERTATMTRLETSGHFLPKRSERSPKIIAPKGRKSRVTMIREPSAPEIASMQRDARVIEVVIAWGSLSKVLVRRVTLRDTAKKLFRRSKVSDRGPTTWAA